MAEPEHMDVGTDQMLAFVEDQVGWMVYNNPARRNAVSLDMAVAIPKILGSFQGDLNVKVIVITGTGDKAFVSGRDISQLTDGRPTGDVARIWADHEKSWTLVDKPIIGMVRGYCIGGGLGTALEADIRIAAEGAKFGHALARMGVAPRLDSLDRLVSVVGRAWASEILFSCRQLSAHEAFQCGLVNRVVADEDLENAVRELAGSIAVNAPLSLRAIKVGLQELQVDPEKRDSTKVESLIDACLSSEDFAEGKRAFLEKRKPVFRGV